MAMSRSALPRQSRALQAACRNSGPYVLKSVPVRRAVIAQAAANATAPKPDKKAAAPAAPKAFTNINRFIVPKDVQQPFIAEWRKREADMQQHAGFQGFELVGEGNNFTVSSSWASIPEWEAWSLSDECRRSHLPSGIWQYVPKKGEGFPEDFVPFKDYDEAVNAKY